MSAQGNKLTAIADAIREKDGTTALIEANDFPERIRAIETGVDTSDATATASDIAQGKTAYVDGEKVTGSIQELASGSMMPINGPFLGYSPTEQKISVQGMLAQSALVRSGNVCGINASGSLFGDATASDVKSGKTFTSINGAKVTGTAPTQAAKTWTPTTSSQTIASGTYLTGTQTIAGSSNLVASNIKQGVTIFGITGTVSPGVDTSDATATASMIRSGYTAYVKGSKITGTVSTQSAKTVTPKTYAQTAVASGRITTGAVTVAGDANLKAENIKSGVSIFGVSGTANTFTNISIVLRNSSSRTIQYSMFGFTRASTLAVNNSITKNVPLNSTLVLYDTGGDVSISGNLNDIFQLSINDMYTGYHSLRVYTCASDAEFIFT